MVKNVERGKIDTIITLEGEEVEVVFGARYVGFALMNNGTENVIISASSGKTAADDGVRIIGAGSSAMLATPALVDKVYVSGSGEVQISALMELVNPFKPSPQSGGSSGGDGDKVTKSNVNGNIKVNSLEMKVYDDTLITEEINKNAGDIAVLDSEISSPNLLDNSYFIDAVNQRGKTTYTSGYGIDRWSVTSGISIGNNCIIFSQKNSTLSQRLEPALKAALEGKEVTLSVLTNKGLFYGTLPYTANPSKTEYWFNDNGYIEGANLTSFPGNILFLCLDPNCTLLAAKLELGNRQTLAHQDKNGNWILNDPPPNKALELAKCQRYQVVLCYEDGVSQSPVTVGHFTAGAVGDIEIQCITPVPMRIIPAVKVVGAITAVRYGPGVVTTLELNNVEVDRERGGDVRMGANSLQIIVPCDWSWVFERADYGMIDIRKTNTYNRSYFILDSNL